MGPQKSLKPHNSKSQEDCVACHEIAKQYKMPAPREGEELHKGMMKAMNRTNPKRKF